MLTSVSCSGNISHWLPEPFATRAVHTLADEDNELFALDYTCDGSAFAAGGKQLYINVWDTETSRLCTSLSSPLSQMSCVGHTNRLQSIKTHPRSPCVLYSAGWDSTVQVSEIASCAKHAICTHHAFC